jgi:hypothetical protein
MSGSFTFQSREQLFGLFGADLLLFKHAQYYHAFIIADRITGRYGGNGGCRPIEMYSAVLAIACPVFVNPGTPFGIAGALLGAALGFGDLSVQSLLGAVHLFLHALVGSFPGLAGAFGNPRLLFS